MSTAQARWRDRIASLGCVVGRRRGGCSGPVELHHVAEGSGVRNEWALVPLCTEHHRGATGLHGGTKAFIRLQRPVGDSEWGLLAWLIEDLARST